MDGFDAKRIKAFEHARADAAQIIEMKFMDFFRQIGIGDGDQAVGLPGIRRQLRQQAIGRQADRAIQIRPGPIADRLLDATGQRQGIRQIVLIAPQPAGDFINRMRGMNGNASIDGFDDAMMR